MVDTERPERTLHVETLPYNAENDDDSSSRPKRRRKRSKTLVFNETVTVVTIPMRNEYSRHVRSKLWSNRLELQQNAARNAIEFAFEGWNWRTVVEDELMYVCALSGERIHPCHCDRDFDAVTASPPPKI